MELEVLLILELIALRQEVLLLQEVTPQLLQEVIQVLQEILLLLLEILETAHHELQNLETIAIKALAQELMKEAELELILVVEKETQVEEEDKPTTLRTKSIDTIGAFFYA